MLLDLHCHSTCSDGALSVTELAHIAREKQFEFFAITDHDSIEPNAVLQKELEKSSVQFISGIELSSSWNGVGVHVVGLNFDPGNSGLLEAVEFQQNARMKRAEVISRRMQRVGLKDGLEKIMQSKTDGAYIGRPDFAQLLVEENLVEDLSQAYKRHLGAGKPGDVKSQWLDLESVISAIHQADGLAILAHPLHYNLTNSKMKRLLKDFKLQGGAGMEVISGYQNPDKTGYLKTLCEQFELLASLGSDFHRPCNWKHLGCEMEMLQGVTPVWDHFVAR